MTLQLRDARPADLAAIMAIEQQGFTPAEAASKDAMAERIRLIPDSFVVATENEKVVGYIVGPAISARYLTDDLFEHLTANDSGAPYLSVLSLAVAPNDRGAGIGTKLLGEFACRAHAAGRRGVTLTRLERLVPYYEAHDFKNEGQAESTHAGEVWYNMVQEL